MVINANICFTNNYLFRVAVTRTGLYKGFDTFISVKTCLTSYLMNFAFFYGGPSYLKAFWWPPVLEMASHGATCNVFVSAFTGNSAHQVICSSKLKTLKPGKFSQLSFVTTTAWLKSAHREKKKLPYTPAISRRSCRTQLHPQPNVTAVGQKTAPAFGGHQTRNMPVILQKHFPPLK